MKHCGLSRVTVGEGLVPNVKPSFFWFTDIEITQDDAHSVGIRRPMWSDETQSVTQLSQGKFWFKMDVDNHLALSPRLLLTI